MFSEELKARIADDFPGLKTEVDGRKVRYLDSAATSLKPQQMIDAVNEYYSGISSNVHRGKSYCMESVSNRFERGRYRVAELLSCSGNEVVFLQNTTDAINLIAAGLGLSKDDNVVTCSDSHHSNLLPWMSRATVHVVRSDDTANLDMDHYAELLAAGPKVVAITHCSNVTGVYNPIDQMIRMAKEVGAIVVIDAAQSIPHRKINVKEMGADFLTFSAHKMLGPTGLGVLYGDKEKLKRLQPVNFGGGMVDWVGFDEYRLRKIPHRFEAGTPHIAGVYGLSAAIEYINNIGYPLIEQHDKTMGSKMLEMALERDYMEVINSRAKDRGAALSFKIPSSPNLDDAARILSDTYGVICRNGHLCAQPYIDEHAASQVLRVSAYLYTTDSDIDYFFDSLDEVSELLF